MATPRTLVLTGDGINCDEETAYAFEKAGGYAKRVHVNDLIGRRENLMNYQILAFPGGFSYGDDTGAGVALANKIRNNLFDDIQAFVAADKLAIGICNGFQVMVNLGLLPATNNEYGKRQSALLHNDSARYIDRWVDLECTNHSVWTKGLEQVSFPIAHGEGKFYAKHTDLEAMKEKNLIAATYVHGEICEHESLPANPNGSLEDIAAISDESGRLIGMMPHPERAVHFTQLPHWTLLREQLQRKGKPTPQYASGIHIFKNGVEYFK